MPAIGRDQMLEEFLAARGRKIPLESYRQRGRFANKSIAACRELFACFGEIHGSFREQREHSMALDPKNFFLNKLVNEVLIAATANVGWCLNIIDIIQNGTGPDFMVAQAIFDVIHQQQNLHVRKLFECLLFATLFQSSDDCYYYEHLLLLFDLDQHLSRIQDKNEFYERVSLFEQEIAQNVRQEILELEAKYPILLHAWYLSKHDSKKRLQKQGTAITSTRDLYKQVVKSSDLRACSLTGFSYEMIFGSTSKFVHFVPSRVNTWGPITLHDIEHLFSLQALLEPTILFLVMKLLGDVPGPNSTEIHAMVEAPLYRQSIEAQKKQKTFQLGEYVVVGTSLFKIIEVHTSKYLASSYFISPLTPTLNGDNWVSGGSLTRLGKGADKLFETDEAALQYWNQSLK